MTRVRAVTQDLILLSIFLCLKRCIVRASPDALAYMLKDQSRAEPASVLETSPTVAAATTILISTRRRRDLRWRPHLIPSTSGASPLFPHTLYYKQHSLELQTTCIRTRHHTSISVCICPSLQLLSAHPPTLAPYIEFESKHASKPAHNPITSL